jgi:hypothetical protein
VAGGDDVVSWASLPLELLCQDVNKQLFSTWLSITYLAFAQVGPAGEG